MPRVLGGSEGGGRLRTGEVTQLIPARSLPALVFGRSLLLPPLPATACRIDCLGALHRARPGRQADRGTSLIRNRLPPGPFSRPMPIALWGMGVSNERGAPVHAGDGGGMYAHLLRRALCKWWLCYCHHCLAPSARNSMSIEKSPLCDTKAGLHSGTLTSGASFSQIFINAITVYHHLPNV